MRNFWHIWLQGLLPDATLFLRAHAQRCTHLHHANVHNVVHHNPNQYDCASAHVFQTRSLMDHRDTDALLSFESTDTSIAMA